MDPEGGSLELLLASNPSDESFSYAHEMEKRERERETGEGNGEEEERVWGLFAWRKKLEEVGAALVLGEMTERDEILGFLCLREACIA